MVVDEQLVNELTDDDLNHGSSKSITDDFSPQNTISTRCWRLSWITT